MKTSTTKYHWLMLLTLVLIATSFPVAATITNGLPPAVMMFVRFLLAALLFAPYVFIKNGLALPPGRNLFYYSILSIPLVIFFWCMFESLRYTSVLNTGALYTLVPAMTAVFALIINKEITNRFRIFGLCLGTAGALWIVFRGDYQAFIRLELNYGDLVFVIGCVFMALYNPLIKKLHEGEPMEIMTFWVLLLGAGWLLILSGSELLDIDWLSIEATVYAGIVYLALFCTLISFFLLQLCVIQIGATKVAAYGFLTPLLIIVISLIFGIDEFDAVIFPGIILVIVSMYITQREPTPA